MTWEVGGREIRKKEAVATLFARCAREILPGKLSGAAWWAGNEIKA